jgi:hypothetical protein
MRLNLGQRLVEKQGKTRWQVIDIGPAEILLRRLTYRASLDGRGPMAWCPCYGEDEEDAMRVHRAHVDMLFSMDET